MKKLFFLVFVSIFFYSNCFANNYTEDNGAFWYMKALESLPEYNYISHFAPNRLDDENIKKIPDFNLDILNKYVEYINKARSQEKCFFYVLPKYEGDENMVIPEMKIYSISNKFNIASDLASYAMSVHKPEYASLIWLSNLEAFLNIAQNNSITVRITIGASINYTLKALSNSFDNGVAEEFKKPFIDFMKAWPSSVFDLNVIKKVHYDYYMQNLERFSNDIEALARVFGYDKNSKLTRIVKNKDCVERLSKMEKEMQVFFIILHLYLYKLQEYDNDSIEKFLVWEAFTYFFTNKDKISKILDEMNYPQLIKYMLGVIFIFTDNDYICPENGFRTLEVKTANRQVHKNKCNYNFIACSYNIKCSCKGKEENVSTEVNTAALEKAREYKKTLKFNKDKEDFKKYCTALLNIDFSKELTKKDLSIIDKSTYFDNKMMNKIIPNAYGLGTKIDRIKKLQKVIENFIEKYSSN